MNRLYSLNELTFPEEILQLVSRLSVDGALLYFYGEGLSEMLLKTGYPRCFQFASSLPIYKVLSLLNVSISDSDKDYLYKSKVSELLLASHPKGLVLMQSEFLSEEASPFYIEILCDEDSFLSNRTVYWSIDEPVCDFNRIWCTQRLEKDAQNKRLSFDIQQNSAYLERSVFWISLIRYANQFGWDWEWMKIHFDKSLVQNHFRRRLLLFRRFFKREWIRLFDFSKPSVVFEAMRTIGLLDIILPELMEGYQVEQNEYHAYDVYYHGIYSCDAAEEPLIRMSALMHDIGKPRAKKKVLNGNKQSEPYAVFYDHENIGARMTFSILKRFGLRSKTVHQVTKLVRLHMFHYTKDWRDGAVRRFISKAGQDSQNLFKLRAADRLGSGKKTKESKALKNLIARIEKIQNADNQLSLKDLAINGHHLMNILHIPAGPRLGIILKHLLHLVASKGIENEQTVLLYQATLFINTTCSD